MSQAWQAEQVPEAGQEVKEDNDGKETLQEGSHQGRDVPEKGQEVAHGQENLQVWSHQARDLPQDRSSQVSQEEALDEPKGKVCGCGPQVQGDG